MSRRRSAADRTPRCPPRVIWLRLLLVLVPIALAAALSLPASFWFLDRVPDGVVRWLLRTEPGAPRPRIVMGERLLARGETRAALRQFERAATLGSQDLRL